MSITDTAAEGSSPTGRDSSELDEHTRSGGASGEPTARRPITAWDLAGVAALVSLTSGIHLSGVLTAGTGMGDSGLVQVGATAWIGATLLLLVGLVLRDRPTPRRLAALLVNVWRQPPGDWVAFVLGCALAVPLLGMYAPLLFADADSARIVAAVLHVQQGGFGFLRETQDNLLPHVLLGPAIAVRGLAGAKLMAIVSVIVFAGVVAYVSRRATGSMAAAAATTLALLSMQAVVDRAAFLPMYSTMLALAYAGGWLAYRAITDRSGRWAYGLGAGICLSLAPEAQPVGVLFAVVPLLLVVFTTRWRITLRALAIIYGTVVVVSLPRLALNLSEGGSSRIASYRTDYWVTEGYVREIQQHFWRYHGVSEPLGEYLTKLPERFVNTLGVFGWITLVAAVVAWIFCSRRVRWFALSACAFFLLAITVKQVPPFPRYYSPLWPGIALLVGAGVSNLARRRTTAPRVAAVTAIALLSVMAVGSINHRIDALEPRRQDVLVQPYADLVARIDDGKGVIGARSHSLLNVTADIPTYGGQFLSEQEYVTYLTWPSDAEVLDVMQEHDIGWVLIHGKRILETEYHNTWLIPHHGERARHVEQIMISPNFCPVADVGGFVLFRVGPCPPVP